MYERLAQCSVDLHYGSVLEDKLGGFWVFAHLPLP